MEAPRRVGGGRAARWTQSDWPWGGVALAAGEPLRWDSEAEVCSHSLRLHPQPETASPLITMVLIGGPLGISLAGTLKQYSAGLYNSLKPLANAYARAAGHRKVGLRYDDLIIEERVDVEKALSRLPSKEGYDRVYRMRVAFQQDLMRRPLPKEEWLKAEDDVRYLTPYIQEVSAEDAERAKWDSIEVERKAV